MRIEQSLVSLASRREATVTDVTRSSKEAWIGDRPAQNLAAVFDPGPSQSSQAAAIARLSDQTLGLARSLSSRLSAATAGAMAVAGPSSTDVPDASDPAVSDPKLVILKMLIERLTGRKINLIRPGDVQANADATAQRAGREAAAAATGNAPAQPQQVGWGVDVRVEQIHQETETTAFKATGQVITSDGRSISFDYQLQMHRELTQTSTFEFQAGDAVRKVDPIALNLSGGPVALSATRSALDIDSDGTAELVALPAAGTYFLALDANGNGSIDNGSELFGPTTGNGFTELRAFDSNGNGWIDEGDAAFAVLKLWSGPGAALKSLDEAGVGALYVGQTASTQFDLRTDGNETMGQVVSSSVYLGANGMPGALQQVDLTV